MKRLDLDLSIDKEELWYHYLRKTAHEKRTSINCRFFADARRSKLLFFRYQSVARIAFSQNMLMEISQVFLISTISCKFKA